MLFKVLQKFLSILSLARLKFLCTTADITAVNFELGCGFSASLNWLFFASNMSCLSSLSKPFTDYTSLPLCHFSFTLDMLAPASDQPRMPASIVKFSKQHLLLSKQHHAISQAWEDRSAKQDHHLSLKPSLKFTLFL